MWRGAMGAIAVVVFSAAISARPSPSLGQERPIGETTVWSQVPEPRSPEGLVVSTRGSVYVGTHTPASGNSDEGPSRIFRYDLTGKRLDSVTVRGQNTDATHGILAMAFDRRSRLYVLDRNPPRVLRFSPTLQQQRTYARFPDLPACNSAEEGEPCTPTENDTAPFPDYIAFDKEGNAYVTDLESALIYLVRPGGGKAEIWFADPRLDSVFGPNGIAVDASRTKLYFAMTGSLDPSKPANGIIYTLPVTPAPKPEDLQEFFTYTEPAAGPDGIAFGKSGKLYVVLAGSNQISILEPDGTEAIRFPAAPDNQQQEVPYDLPASAAFDGSGYLLVTNQSFFTDNEAHMVVLSAWVNDVALPLIRPRLP
jgi:sugar lactone lactonase YvrE